MAACVQDAALLVDAFHVDAQLLFQHVQLLVEVEAVVHHIVIDIIAYLFEDPRTAKGGAAHHDGIHAIAFEGRLGLLGRGDVAVADDGDVDARVALHLANQGPVGLAGVHLCAGAAVDGQRLDAAVLQLLGQLGDDELVLVPAQARLHGNGQLHGVHHLLGDLQQFGDVLQHAGAGALASHLLHRTAEVQVDEVWTGLLNDLGRLDHCLHVAAVDLNAHGALFVADGELLLGGLHVANQGFSAHKLGIDHRGAKALAQQAEANVGNIFHRCQKHRVWTKFYISYLHGCKGSYFFLISKKGHSGFPLSDLFSFRSFRNFQKGGVLI